MYNTPLLAVISCCLLAIANAVAASPSSSTVTVNATATPSVKMTISNEPPGPSLSLAKVDLAEATFADKEPDIDYPQQARFDRVSQGSAAIGVMVDAEGNGTDLVAIRYTHPAFAEEMMNALRNERFTPRKFKGVAVPGRFYVVRKFALSDRSLSDETKPATVAMNPMEQMGARSDRVSNSKDGPAFIYKARGESEIDGHILKITSVGAPSIPADCEPAIGEALKIVVTFYVDGGGDVRLPNVESAAPPELVAATIKAVMGWKFERPTIKRKPALVFTTRTLIFEKNALPSNPVAANTAAPAGK